MEKNIPRKKWNGEKTGSAILIISMLGFVITIILVFVLISNNLISLNPLEGGAYRWAAELEYPEEVNIDQLTLAMEGNGYEVFGEYFREDPGIERIWNVQFFYNLTASIDEYSIQSPDPNEWGDWLDNGNGTITIPIQGEVYNNYYNANLEPDLRMYDIYIFGPWSYYGSLFDDIDWKQVMADEMPGLIELIREATGLEPRSSGVVKQYS